MKRFFERLMADGALGGGPSLGGFDDDDADETEIITLAPGEAPPSEEEGDEDDGKVTLTKEEYDQLRNGRDNTGLLAEGLKELKDVLGSQQQQPANLQQQPGESDEEFEKRLEQDLFAEGKSGKAIKEAVQRYGGGQVSQLMSMISAQNKKLMQLDEENGPIFKRYKGEIEKIVQDLPVEQQNHPQVWEYALTQVKNTHRDELQEETVEQLVERRVAEKLKEMGIGEGGSTATKRTAHVEGASGRGSANAGAGRGKKRVYVTDEDRRIANEKGIPVEKYIERKGARR